MIKLNMAVLSAVVSLFVFSPAQAIVTICEDASCLPKTDENVLVDSGTGFTLTGKTNQTHTGITFTSPVGEELFGPSQGQARVEAVDGLLNGLTFTIADGFAFRSAVFNLNPLSGNAENPAFQVSLSYLLADGGFASKLFDVNENGQNFFGISGDAGERFTSITFLSDPVTTGIGDLRQLRLGGVAAVPEPASWAMLIAGFGLVGGVMRRRRSSGQQVMLS